MEGIRQQTLMGTKGYKHTPEGKAKMRAKRNLIPVVKAITDSDIARSAIGSTLLLLKEVDARTRINFIQVKNLQAEISQLKSSLDKLAAALLELTKIDNIPTTEAEAVIRDFLFNKHKQ